MTSLHTEHMIVVSVVDKPNTFGILRLWSSRLVARFIGLVTLLVPPNAEAPNDVEDTSVSVHRASND